MIKTNNLPYPRSRCNPKSMKLRIANDSIGFRYLETSMQEFEQVSSLIADIYDAALDPARWDDVLRAARDFVGGSAAALFSKDVSVQSLNVYYDCGGIDPHYTRLYS